MPNEYNEPGATTEHFTETNDSEADLITNLDTCQSGVANDSRAIVGKDSSGNAFVCAHDRLFAHDTTTAALTVNASANVGIGIASPDGKLHVHTATAGAVTAASSADDLVLENSDNVGLSFLCPNNKTAYLTFGDPDDNDTGSISYNHSDNSLNIVVNTAQAMTITNSGKVGIGSTSPSSLLDLEVAGTVEAITDVLEITSRANDVTMANTGVAVLFNLGYYDEYTPGTADAARITVANEGDWISSAASQDARMSFSVALDGTITERVRIGSLGALSTYLTGTAKSTVDALALTNLTNAADMDGTGTAILFNQWYYDASTPAVADAGRISVVTETDWTSTASTQDAYMAFGVAENGTITTRLKIESDGDIVIGGGKTDPRLTFDGNGADGYIYWDESDLLFTLSNSLCISSGTVLNFGGYASTEFIEQVAAGTLNLNAATTIAVNTATLKVVNEGVHIATNAKNMSFGNTSADPNCWITTDSTVLELRAKGSIKLYTSSSGAGLCYTFDDVGLKPNVSANVTIHCFVGNSAPTSTTEGALWVDADAGGNGHLKVYANGGWRTAATL